MQCTCAVLYCHLWPVWLYRIFTHYLINGTIFGEKNLLNIKCGFWFSLQRLSENFLILRLILQDIIINALTSSCKVPVIIVRFLIILYLSRQIFEKYSYIKFRENPSSGSRVVPRGRTYRHDEADSRFANASKNESAPDTSCRPTVH